MTKYSLCADRGAGQNDIYKIAEGLKNSCAEEVKVEGIGPGVAGRFGLSSASKGWTCIFQVNGVGVQTPLDYDQSYYHYDKVIFVFPQWIGNQWMSDENLRTHKVPDEHDWNRAAGWGNMNRKYTITEFMAQAKKVDGVTGKTPEEVVQNICSGNFLSGKGSGSTTQQQSNVSPLVTGDMTFEELVGEICNGIDLQFLVKRGTVVVDDFESIFAEAKYLRDNKNADALREDISLWEIEQDSYEIEINQHGFYNTVYVEYANGKVKEYYSDFVKIFGEVPITYKDPKIDKTTAIMKAKAYLAAHLRDMEMTVKANMLTNGNIDIGDIITLENPKTKNNTIKKLEGLDPEYLFVTGINTHWNGDELLTTDIECKFAPTSPQKLEVPTAGIGNGSNTNSNTSNDSFDKTGVSKDKKQICGIGKPALKSEQSKGDKYYKSVFECKCPLCQSTELVWGWHWSESDCGLFTPINKKECGSDSGRIFCLKCGAKFSCVEGGDCNEKSKAKLKKISGPTESSESDAEKMKNGTT